ncbi:lipoprotein [[Clostridium] sordellii]|uniref:DUF4358 domain-containing protein n=1 Tax=Paraclostridium sordellii TaxID=1505 RepID=UPI0002EFD27F|nr:DUF4358 domain-containing protein [Paeniclostridium sordellii]TAN66100.1 DUF4358 domain-containing protein [Paeniclostridium sordellii 8483]CEK31253.1 lipoprotein [[Clostridium] sordellii] [Paeniclostridium sordellii]
MRTIKKYIVVLSFALTAFILNGCGINNDKSLNSIVTEINSKVPLNNMQKGDSKALKRFFGLNSNEFKDFVLYSPKSTMDVEEMLIVKLKDKSQAQSVEDAIDSRVNKQIESFSGYGPKQVALLQDYEVKSKGDYVFYSVSNNLEKITDAFKESIKN